MKNHDIQLQVALEGAAELLGKKHQFKVKLSSET